MSESISVLLARVGEGDRNALNDLLSLVYRELHGMAAAYLRREPQGHTLQSTALIHEAYLRLLNYEGAGYNDRTHFVAVAARVMRQVLVDHARSRRAAKRGAGIRVTLKDELDFSPERSGEVVALDDALNKLAVESERKVRLIEMRFFGGMTANEIGECMGMPVHTVRRELRIALAWLRREMAV